MIEQALALRASAAEIVRHSARSRVAVSSVVTSPCPPERAGHMASGGSARTQAEREKILASHALVLTDEGEMFRAAIAEGSRTAAFRAPQRNTGRSSSTR